MDLNLVDQIRSTFNALPDCRKQGNYQKYAVEDAALSALSVFFTQSPSFLDYQRRMQKLHNRNNAQSIFGVHQIPSTSQIGSLPDPIAPETLYPLLAEAGDKLYAQDCLEPFISSGGTLLVVLDGTDSFCSEKISCPCCTRQTLKSSKTLYRHTVVTPVIVAPGQSRVVPLPPEFVSAQDGQEKQDCELAAAKRWLTTWGAHYAPCGITLLGDDLYCHQPFCEVIKQQMDCLFVCKPDSHALMSSRTTAIISTITLLTASSICPTSWLRATYWPSSPILRLNGGTKLTAPSEVRPPRRTFFENFRTLLQFIPFDNWQHLMQFMLNGGIELPVET